MITVGLDDTDVVDSPGTNQLARHIVRQLADRFHTRLVVRHQLLDDPRVPYTSKNGCASLLLEPLGPHTVDDLPNLLCPMIVQWCPAGSDPGLCIAANVPQEIINWGRRCQCELVGQDEARRIAASAGAYLRGLGGTEGGVIGALAAVGLLTARASGRVVFSGSSVDDFYDVTGPQTVESLHSRGIDEVVCHESRRPLSAGVVDVGKRLRPNLDNGRIVLFVRAAESADQPWQAVRLL